MALPAIGNPSFETPSTGGSFLGAPAGATPWTWTGTSTECGIDGRAVIGQYPGGGSQCAYLTVGASNTAVAQSLACDGTPFQVRFAAKWRLGTGDQTLRLSFNGTTVQDFVIVGLNNWAVYTSPTITPPGAGSYELKFLNLTNNRHIYLDEVEAIAVPGAGSPLALLCIEPNTSGFALIG